MSSGSGNVDASASTRGISFRMVWPDRQPTVQSNKDPKPLRSTAPALDEHDTAGVQDQDWAAPHGCGTWPWRAWRARNPCALPMRPEKQPGEQQGQQQQGQQLQGQQGQGQQQRQQQ
ncbi:hypothetical protein HaLaN_07257 [Haematococcus lacustris]|uniref:Uncharacterized protein n=1 Tax=Haematococcus lacustris TaxID=44745 RepID=A0A699Z849_HAELA|nr:hypothetical protein HaLaN_07257 [Haematococcus lacustris]